MARFNMRCDRKDEARGDHAEFNEADHFTESTSGNTVQTHMKKRDGQRCEKYVVTITPCVSQVNAIDEECIGGCIFLRSRSGIPSD